MGRMSHVWMTAYHPNIRLHAHECAWKGKEVQGICYSVLLEHNMLKILFANSHILPTWDKRTL